VNAAKNKHNTYKVGKSFAIDCTTRFDKKIGGIILQTAIERGANGSLQFTETTGLQSAKGGFAVIILCQDD